MLSCRIMCICFVQPRLNAKSLPTIHRGLEAMDKQVNDARDECFWSHLAGRILRPRIAIERKLQTEVGLRKRECNSGKAGCKFGAMAVARRSRVAKVVTGIAHRDGKGRALDRGRDH